MYRHCATLMPEGFDVWFARAVERDAGRRFAGVDELVEELLALLLENRRDPSCGNY